MKSACGIAVVLLAGMTVRAGPLTPPPGPVAPTHKTLTQIEPRTPIQSLAGDADSMHRITQHGSYYLTGDLVLGEGKTTGIEVAADGVTIDLNGFTLNGLNTSGTFGIRVTESFSCDALTVRNGHITDWGSGVGGLGLFGATFENLRVTFNDDYGIDAGDKATIINCSAVVCGTGFYLRNAGVIMDSSAGFSGRGFDLGDGAIASRCQSGDCGDGFYLNFNAIADTCAALNCFSGFIGVEANTVSNCRAQGCFFNGIDVGSRAHITNCAVGGGGGNGIAVHRGSTVDRCTVSAVPLKGIISRDACVIRDNAVSDCGGMGISAEGSHAIITGNSVVRCNLDIGILVEGDNNQLEMNRVEGSGLEGIKVIGTRNLVIRNRVCASSRNAPGLPDYDMPPSNFAGTVMLPAAFTGTSEVNANFSCGPVPPDFKPATTARPAQAAPSRHPERPAIPTPPAAR